MKRGFGVTRMAWTGVLLSMAFPPALAAQGSGSIAGQGIDSIAGQRDDPAETTEPAGEPTPYMATGGNIDEAWALATREELQSRLDHLTATVELSGPPDAKVTREQAEARVEAEAIRTRLRDGDFHEGDLVFLTVEGEEALSDTFQISSGLILSLPTLGKISMYGVLRSELEQHLVEEIGTYIRDPSLEAQQLIRLSIQGEVNQPGFYVYPPELALADALMLAGGPETQADLNRISISRSGHRILGGESLLSAVGQGESIAQLDLRSGDLVQIQERPTQGLLRFIIFTTIGAVVVAGVTTLIR